MNRNVFNFLAFQLGWFACVLSAANGVAWGGALAVILVLIIHLKWMERARDEAMLISCAVITGFILDGLLVNSGWVKYASGSAAPGLAPYWILAMWALFATTLNLSMAWLKNRYLLASVMGGVFGPISYLAGERLGAMEILSPLPAIVTLALMWSLAMPFLVWLTSKFDGARANSAGRLNRLDMQAVASGRN